MIITNNYNLPEVIVNATSKAYKPKEGRLSATTLIAPPLIRALTVEFWDTLTTDVSEKLWMILGNAVHYIFEGNAPDNSLAEEKLEIPFGDLTIVSKSDLLNNGKIDDYKVTSVWSFILGEKPEWIGQLNINAWCYRKLGFEVTGLRIQAILRDWKRREALQNDDYPQIPFQTIEVPLWTFEEQERYITERVKLFLVEPKECTPKEKWSKPDVWAVKKAGNKTARGGKLCYSKAEADNFISSNPAKKWDVEFRKGECLRCKEYCNVRTVCKFNIYKDETI